jgi:hypothetical protein
MTLKPYPNRLDQPLQHLSSNQQQQTKSTPKTTQPQATTYSSQQQLNENVSCTTIPPTQSAAFYLLPTHFENEL